MQKDIVSIANFLFENNTRVFNDGEGLVIYFNSLRAVMSEVEEAPEYIKLSIKEGALSYKPIITQLIPVNDIKHLITGVWKQMERQTNQEFIGNYGLDIYEYIRNSYLQALKGETENESFSFNLVKKSDAVNINLKHKSSGMIDSAEFNLKGVDSRKNIYGAAVMPASASIRINHNNQHKWISSGFIMCLPTIELEEYDLGIKVFKPYNQNNELDYLMSHLKESNNKNLLTAFQLQNELSEKDVPVKKLKI
jgi:hypothetical protein